MIEIEYGDIEIVDDTIQEEVDTVIEFEDDLELVQEALEYPPYEVTSKWTEEERQLYRKLVDLSYKYDQILSREEFYTNGGARRYRDDTHGRSSGEKEQVTRQLNTDYAALQKEKTRCQEHMKALADEWNRMHRK